MPVGKAFNWIGALEHNFKRLKLNLRLRLIFTSDNFTLLALSIIALIYFIIFSSTLTLFRMAFLGAAHRWGRGGGQKASLSLKSVTHILKWWNLAQLYLTQRIYESHDTPCEFCWHHNFSPEISFKKCRYRLHFDT